MRGAHLIETGAHGAGSRPSPVRRGLGDAYYMDIQFARATVARGYSAMLLSPHAGII
jgi:hypothetical protein